VSDLNQLSPQCEVRIPLRDGGFLATTLYLPAAARSGVPQPCIIEALPYRKDDVTCTYRPEYEVLRDRYSYAVARIDLRGTGSSSGRATDEYPASEQQDLTEAIAWLAAQPWCSGNVGMYGTSYSGFNSIQLAMERPPHLTAIVAIYATDDRYTDDVHYLGGALKWLDLIDYCHYMTPMNAMPPVPALWGDGWADEWRARIEEHEPWLFAWLEHQRRDDYWQHGSLRPDYGAIEIPTMLVAGWADGYRNNSLRTAAALSEHGVPHRVLFGPWAHASTSSSRPGPRIDLVPEMVRWWDRWLREDEMAQAWAVPGATIEYFARRSTRPEPDLVDMRGQWRAEVWPSPRVTDVAMGLTARRAYPVRADVGTDAWISCAGHAPYGTPLDQRLDDALSLTWEWDADELELLGHARLQATVVVDQPVASLAVKLCDVFPDGTSSLVTRGLLNLVNREGMAAAEPMPTGQPVDVEVELEVTSWQFDAGHRLRLSVAGTDWPNTAAPPVPVTLELRGGQLLLPVVQERSPFADPVFVPGGEPEEVDPRVDWVVERDVLRRTTTCRVDHGSSWPTPYGTATDHYAGSVSVDQVTFAQTATADVTFGVDWPEAQISTSSHLDLRADADSYDVSVTLRAERDGALVAERAWHRTIPRDLT
jgi:putative CocE/NonD family hydrolase